VTISGSMCQNGMSRAHAEPSRMHGVAPSMSQYTCNASLCRSVSLKAIEHCFREKYEPCMTELELTTYELRYASQLTATLQRV